jgi:hypothetical protein
MKCYIPLLASMLSLMVVSLTGCRSAYYATEEKFGVYKRDLLKKDVIKARNDQAAAQEQFKDALTRLKELTKFEGGDLEKAYNSLKSEYDGCASRVEAVHKRVHEVETVANDLFAEWEKEIKQIGTASLREASQQKLTDTRHKYSELHSALKSAEQTMDPVLGKLRDYVLFLKHDLNAAAIGSLQGEAANIQAEIARLIQEMSRSIARADEFIKSAT